MTNRHRFILFVTVVLVLVFGVAGAAFALDPVPTARGTDWACEYAGDCDPGFTDTGMLSADTQAAIGGLSFYGITMGYSDQTYRPAKQVARWEMALFLARLIDYAADQTAFDLPATLVTPPFSDTAGLSAETKNAIALLYTLEVTKGKTATTFAPNNSVTRYEMASFLVRVQNLLEPGSYATAKRFFSDVDPAKLDRAADIDALAAQGIVVGYGDGTYGPMNAVLRSQMALYLMRMVDENVEAGRLPAAVLPVDDTPVTITVAAGEEKVIAQTTYAQVLTIGAGGSVVAPAGKEVTLTVNNVEIGGALVTTAGVETKITGPATYTGNIVLTITDQNFVPYAQQGGGPPPGGGDGGGGEGGLVPAADEPPADGPPPAAGPLMFPFRQALYLDETGLVGERSVTAAIAGMTADGFVIRNPWIRSTGENFNGVFASGGEWTLDDVTIDFTGNARSDFIGYGAAVVARGEDTSLVLDGAHIETDGVVRTAVVADTGSNVVVKNSHIQTNDGVLPADYVPTIDTTQMRSVPWMLGLAGNNRATNLLGTNTKASYINSYVGAEGWGVLSTDGCTTPTLTAINSTIAITGDDGYGSYGIGDATEYFYGCNFDVASYATISRGSHLYYGDSEPARVAQLNTALDLGLTAAELAAIPDRPTIVNSDRWGVMWHGGGTLDVSGGTEFNTGLTTFLDKGQAIEITVDGSEGAQLNPGNGIIMQVMDDDDPGPVPLAMTNTGVYHDPIGPAVKEAEHDVTVADASDALATFTDIVLDGDFFNSTRGGVVQGPFGPPSSASKNLGLTFLDSSIVGVISASTALHPGVAAQDGISAEDYREIGMIENTVAAPVNNGVLVTLDGDSQWVVTGTSYLTVLAVGVDATVIAPAGRTLVMRVDDVVTPIVPDTTYKGIIELTVVGGG